MFTQSFCPLTVFRQTHGNKSSNTTPAAALTSASFLFLCTKLTCALNSYKVIIFPQCVCVHRVSEKIQPDVAVSCKKKTTHRGLKELRRAKNHTDTQRLTESQSVLSYCVLTDTHTHRCVNVKMVSKKGDRRREKKRDSKKIISQLRAGRHEHLYTSKQNAFSD